MSVQEQLQSKEIAIQYEARLLGSLLINPNQFEEIAEIIGFDDFIGQLHPRIFQSIAALRDIKEPVHALSVTENLAKSAILMGSTSPVTLPMLQAMANESSPLGGRSDARKVRERSALRRLSDTGARITNLADSASASPESIVEEINGIAEETSKTIECRGAMIENFVPYEVAMGDYLTHLTALSENPEVNDGIRTGIADLDEYLQFLGPGYHVIAARPGCGKTALALSIATGAYESTERNQAVPVSSLFHTIEMPMNKMMLRLLAQRSGVPISSLRRGQLSDLEWSLVTKALTEMQSAEMWFDPTRAITTNDLAARIRRYKREKKSRNGLILLDYLQLISPPGGARISSGNPLDYVSQAVASLAKENDVAIVALAQLNRDLEKRVNKRPIMSDLKGSGQIEQDADSIFFAHRDPKTPDLLELIVAKNREGEPNHTIDLGFAGAKQQFYQVNQRSQDERESQESNHGSRDNESRVSSGSFGRRR